MVEEVVAPMQSPVNPTLLLDRDDFKDGNLF
jgi:hypothetical protein